MDKETFIASDPAFAKAVSKLELLRAGTCGRWGEARRFAGARAGNRLDQIQRAELSWSRAYDRAEARFNKLTKIAASSRKPV